MDLAMKIEGLELTRGQMRLGPLDFSVARGDSLALIGPNGAGKTTLIRCMLGLVKSDRGAVQINGMPVDLRFQDWKEKLGFVIDRKGFFEHLSVEDNLRFVASFYRTWDYAYCRFILRRMDLDPKARVSKLSSGQLAKLAFTAAISHRPELLVMDEPTSGMDPGAKAEFLHLVKEHLRSEENALFMSSHTLSDIAPVTNRVAFLDKGRLVHMSGKDALLNNWRRISFRIEGDIPEDLAPVSVEREGSVFLVTTSNGNFVLAKLREARAELLESSRMTLEDISAALLKGENV